MSVLKQMITWHSGTKWLQSLNKSTWWHAINFVKMMVFTSGKLAANNHSILIEADDDVWGNNSCVMDSAGTTSFQWRMAAALGERQVANMTVGFVRECANSREFRWANESVSLSVCRWDRVSVSASRHIVWNHESMLYLDVMLTSHKHRTWHLERRQIDTLFNNLFRPISKKTLKLRTSGSSSTIHRWFPSQKAQ